MKDNLSIKQAEEKTIKIRAEISKIKNKKSIKKNQ